MSIITRKIQLLICDYDKSEKKYSVSEKGDSVYKSTWSELDRLDNYCPRISNLVMSKLINNTNFLMEDFTSNKKGERDYVYGIGKVIINDLNLNNVFDGYSEILEKICTRALKKIDNDKKEIKSGKRSIATFKQGMPIPFSKNKKFVKQKNKYYITLFGLHFELHFGRDRSNNRYIIEQIEKRNYKLCESSIQLKGKKDKKIFLMLVVETPKKNVLLDKNICLGVDLGTIVPAYLALSSNPYYRMSLGNFKEYRNKRLGIQGARRRIQSLDIGVSGKGRKHKNKKLEKIQAVEKNYCDTYEHRIAKLIIDEALKNNAGTIKLEDLTGYEGNKFILRNWGYYGFQTKIQEKALEHNIDIKFIDPAYTSKTCHKCFHINKDLDYSNKNKQMDNERYWICPNCSEKLQRDWNAAINIVNSTNYTKKNEKKLNK